MRVRKREKLLKKRSEAEIDDASILVYQDEVHFQIQATITSGWYKKGSSPSVKSFAGRYKVSYSGFVIPKTGELFVTKPGTFTYETTIAAIREFLKAKPAPEGKYYVIVMDNAPWHKKAIRLIAEERRPEYSDIFNQVKFLKLPPYSPDLNPIEQVWRITRKENTHNKFFPSMEVLSETVNKAFKAWEQPNAQLMSLCSYK